MKSIKRDACPACGACSFMGTASTMQVMAEALGLALPGTALIRIDIPARELNITGIGGGEKTPEEIGRILSERRSKWIKPESRHNNGILSIFTRNCVSPVKGGCSTGKKMRNKRHLPGIYT